MQHVGRFGTLVGFALNILGTALLVIWPEQKLIGWGLLALGIVTLLATVAWWIYCNRVHFRERIKLVGPIHVIILGLAIACGGVAWSFYRNQSKEPSVAEQVAAITAPLMAELDQYRAHGVIVGKPVLAPLPPKRYTAYEKEQRLRAIDEIYGVITAKLSPAYTEGQALFRTVQSGVADSMMTTKLVDHSNNVKVAFDDLMNLLQKYEYFTDIITVAKQNTFNGLTEIVGSQNLAGELYFLKNNVAPHASMRDFWNRDMILFEANNANRDFGNYLTETLPRLKQKRSEIESAEVYTGQQ